MSAVFGLHYKVRKLFLNEQEVSAKKNGIEWHSGFQPLMTFNGRRICYFVALKHSPPHRDRRCGARAEGKLVCVMPSREEEDEGQGDLGGG